MGNLFDALERHVDLTAGPTLEPRSGAALTGEEIERQRRRESAAVTPSIITSPFVEPERPAEIGTVTAAADLENKAAGLLKHVKAAGTLGLSDADLAIKLRCTRSTVCSTRNHVRHHLWIARRVHGGLGVDVIAWRIASADERARNDAHERQLAAAGQRWSPIKPTAPKKSGRRR